MRAGLLLLSFVVYLSIIFLFLFIIGLLTGLVRRRKQPHLWRLCLTLSLVFTAISLAAGAVNSKIIVEKDYHLTSAKYLSRSYTIAMISDIHYGTVVNAEMLQDVCDRISAQNPDVILIDGDVVDESTSAEEVQEAFKILSGMHSVYGTWFVYGNHDDMAANGRYQNDVPRSQIVEAALKENHIPVLEDQSTLIANDLILIGRKDESDQYRGETRADLSTLTANLDENKVWLLADHEPIDLSKNADNGIDFMLCGHTHAGQIWPMGFFAELFGFTEMSYGLRQTGNMQTIVSCGVGEWGFPIRTACRPEYLMITISN